MSSSEIFEIAFQIIVNSGEARSMAMESITLAKNSDIQQAKEMLKKSKVELNKAHKYQTSLIQGEANGQVNQVTVLLVHSQDHLMNCMTIIDMAEEFVDLYEKIS